MLVTYLYHLTPQKYCCLATEIQNNIRDQQRGPNYQDHPLTPLLTAVDDPPSFWRRLVSSYAY
jgi:hypothetical protein